MADEIRAITPADLPAVAALLQEGFPNRRPEYWTQGLAHLDDLEVPDGLERYGFVLFVDTVLRGVILAVPSVHHGADGARTFINVSSWYVQPDYRRTRALVLYQRACRRTDVTYTNLTASELTMPAVVRFGFETWTEGQMAGMALGRRRSPSPRARVLSVGESRGDGLPPEDAKLLRDHERYGCVTGCLMTADGPQPLIFRRRQIKGSVPAAQLLYCRSETLLEQYGSTIMTWLWRRGLALLILDVSSKLPSVRGRYFPGRRVRLYKGERPSSFADHSYSEIALFPGVN